MGWFETGEIRFASVGREDRWYNSVRKMCSGRLGGLARERRVGVVARQPGNW